MARGGVDWPLLTVVFALLTAGILTLYSAGETEVPTLAAELWRRQLVWLVVASVAALVAFRISPRILEWAAPALFVTALALLALTLLIGTGAGTASGTRSWLAIAGVRIGQPAELAKLGTILMLARHLAGRRRPPSTMVDFIPSLVIVGVPFVLVGLQPDLGSATVFLGILFAMLFWSGASTWLLLLLASPLFSLLFAFSTVSWGAWIIVLTVLLLWIRPYVLEGLSVWMANVAMGVVALELWKGLAPYQQNRLLSFLSPEVDPRATGWHLIQSKVAIGSGGLFGKGFTLGTQKRLAFLPEQHTDFIFSVVGEEWGFFGVAVALSLFAALLFSLVRIAQKATDPYASLLAAGIGGLLLMHLVQNIGMTIGLMPIMGIPLPFFSYGGSFLVTCIVAMGLALRVSWDAKRSGYIDLG